MLVEREDGGTGSGSGSTIELEEEGKTTLSFSR